MSITCFIRYQIDPFKQEQFQEYARNWGQAIPRLRRTLANDDFKRTVCP